MTLFTFGRMRNQSQGLLENAKFGCTNNLISCGNGKLVLPCRRRDSNIVICSHALPSCTQGGPGNDKRRLPTTSFQDGLVSQTSTNTIVRLLQSLIPLTVKWLRTCEISISFAQNRWSSFLCLSNEFDGRYNSSMA